MRAMARARFCPMLLLGISCCGIHAARHRWDLEEGFASIQGVMAIAALEHAVYVARDEHAIEEALSSARLAVTTYPRGRRVQIPVALLQACDNIVAGPFSAGLRREALATLRSTVACGMVEGEMMLDGVLAVCDHAVARSDLSPRVILQILDSVARSDASTTKTLEAVVDVADALAQVRPSGDFEARRLLFDTASLFARFAHRVAFDSGACRKLVRSTQRIIEATASVAELSSVRSLALSVLQTVAPLTSAEEVFVEILRVVESCVSEWQDAVVMAQAARMLDMVAEGVGREYLERVVDVCAAMSEAVVAHRALATVAGRLIEEGLKRRKGEGLHLLARTLVVLANSSQSLLPCLAALQLLHELGGLEDAPAPADLAALAGAARIPVSSDLALHLDDLVPPLPEERARAQIIEVCATSAPGALYRARSMLYAASSAAAAAWASWCGPQTSRRSASGCSRAARPSTGTPRCSTASTLRAPNALPPSSLRPPRRSSASGRRSTSASR